MTFMVTDNAANMVSGILKPGLCHLPDFTHTLTLIVKKALEEHEVLANIRTGEINLSEAAQRPVTN